MTVDEAIAELERLKGFYGGHIPVRVRLRRSDEFGTVLISRTKAVNITSMEIMERVEDIPNGPYVRTVAIDVPPVREPADGADGSQDTFTGGNE